MAKYRGAKTLADFPEPSVDVFDENWEVIQIYSRNNDQWRFGPNGAFSLDLNVFMADMELHDYPKADRIKYLEQLRIVRAVVLEDLTPPQ